ncbi:MAG: metal ABC transporter permease [Persephonella sp.]|nr:MAG: metal ABC transporter permease [Persephonella sp.]
MIDNIFILINNALDNFIVRSLIGGIILASLLSILSLFVYLKNWSFINVGISHATFGGLALGVFLGVSPTITALIFAILIALLIGYISRNGSINEDVSIGILFSMSMAFGVIILTKTSNYTSDLFSFLFGDILTISENDVFILSIFFMLIIPFIFIKYWKIMFCCYNEEVAYVSGVNTTFYYYTLLVIIAIATVLAVKLVGVILASAMMILPTALSKQFFWHYKKIIIFSVISSITFVVLGIYISYILETPPGATIVFIYSLVFFIVFGINKSKELLR